MNAETLRADSLPQVILFLGRRLHNLSAELPTKIFKLILSLINLGRVLIHCLKCYAKLACISQQSLGCGDFVLV